MNSMPVCNHRFFTTFDPTQKTILIIDDDINYRTTITRWLRTYHFRILEASDSQQGVALAASEKPDMILLDIRISGMHGMECIRLLRQQLGTLLIPVIVITGVDSLEKHIEAYQAGADDVLPKPVDACLLLARVERSLLLWEKLETLTFLDPLTGIYNRRFFDTALSTELHRAIRYKQFFSVVMIDIDFFKQFNDTHGHQAGDFVLRSVAELVRQSLRKQDVVCRYGGEEFSVIMPVTGKADAGRVMDRIRSNMEQTAFTMQPAGITFQVRISAGVAEFPSDARQEADLVNLADQALYRAKNKGRNQVVVYSPE